MFQIKLIMEKVTMLKSIGAYKEGETYEVHPDRALYWIRCKVGVQATKQGSGGGSGEPTREEILNGMKRKELDAILVSLGANPKDSKNVKDARAKILELETVEPEPAKPEEDFGEEDVSDLI